MKLLGRNHAQILHDGIHATYDEEYIVRLSSSFRAKRSCEIVRPFPGYVCEFIGGSKDDIEGGS